MRYTGYVADIDKEADAWSLDFEQTDYQEAEAALVAQDRIRIEWLEGDELYAVTIYNKDGEYGHGQIECTYPSWEGRRSIVKRECGQLTATIIADDAVPPLHKLEEFWIDVEWIMGGQSGRLLFELVRPSP